MAAHVQKRPIGWYNRRTGGRYIRPRPKSRKEKRKIKKAAASGGAVAVESPYKQMPRGIKEDAASSRKESVCLPAEKSDAVLFSKVTLYSFQK